MSQPVPGRRRFPVTTGTDRSARRRRTPARCPGCDPTTRAGGLRRGGDCAATVGWPGKRITAQWSGMPERCHASRTTEAHREEPRCSFFNNLGIDESLEKKTFTSSTSFFIASPGPGSPISQSRGLDRLSRRTFAARPFHQQRLSISTSSSGVRRLGIRKQEAPPIIASPQARQRAPQAYRLTAGRRLDSSSTSSRVSQKPACRRVRLPLTSVHHCSPVPQTATPAGAERGVPGFGGRSSSSSSRRPGMKSADGRRHAAAAEATRGPGVAFGPTYAQAGERGRGRRVRTRGLRPRAASRGASGSPRGASRRVRPGEMTHSSVTAATASPDLRKRGELAADVERETVANNRLSIDVEERDHRRDAARRLTLEVREIDIERTLTGIAQFQGRVDFGHISEEGPAHDPTLGPNEGDGRWLGAGLVTFRATSAPLAGLSFRGSLVVTAVASRPSIVTTDCDSAQPPPPVRRSRTPLRKDGQEAAACFARDAHMAKKLACGIRPLFSEQQCCRRLPPNGRTRLIERHAKGREPVTIGKTTSRFAARCLIDDADRRVQPPLSPAGCARARGVNGFGER